MCTAAAKSTLAIINFITVGAGLFLIGCAVYVQLVLGMWGGLQAFIIGLYALGGVVLFISLLGLCGTISSSSAFLTAYNILLVLLVIAQIGLAIAAFVIQSGNWSGEVHTIINSQFTGMPVNARHSLENTLQCCGYMTQLSDCGYAPPPNTIAPLCQAKLDGLIQQNMKLIAIVALSIAGVEILMCIVGCFVGSKVKAKKKAKYENTLINEARAMNRRNV